jgi:hypothetical protein
MDAFLEDMRGRFESLREIWLADDLLPRTRGRAGDVVLDEEDDEEVDDDLDSAVDDELDSEAFETEEAYHEDHFGDDDELDDFDDEFEDEFDDLESDEFEEELAAVARDNGVSESALRHEEVARRLEERVLSTVRDEPVLGQRSIEIAVVGDGVVELTGAVHAIEEVSRAAALVRGVPGVSMVLNRLEVRAGGTMDTASVARNPHETPSSDERA